MYGVRGEGEYEHGATTHRYETITGNETRRLWTQSDRTKDSHRQLPHFVILHALCDLPREKTNLTIVAQIAEDCSFILLH